MSFKKKGCKCQITLTFDSALSYVFERDALISYASVYKNK